MQLGSELIALQDGDTYQADALRLALSISPYSVPCDKSLGLSLTRSSDLPILARSRVSTVLRNLNFTGVRCESCKVVNNEIKLIISKQENSDTVTEFTLG